MKSSGAAPAKAYREEINGVHRPAPHTNNRSFHVAV
jgi:hypothetical protein